MSDHGVMVWLDYAFFRRSVAATLILSVSMAPLGCLLLLRRMSLIGDAMAHALLPGAAAAFLVFGLALWPMAIGGALAALSVALLAAAFARLTPQREDSAFAALYVTALALGVTLLTLGRRQIDIDLLLFGSPLAVDAPGLQLVAAAGSVTLLLLALLYRALLVEALDPGFLEGRMRRGYGFAFTGLLALNLVAAFQVMGTLLAIGLLTLPASAARFWAGGFLQQSLCAAAFGGAASICGLAASVLFDLPSGPLIVLGAGLVYLLSVVAGPQGGLLRGPRLRVREEAA